MNKIKINGYKTEYIENILIDPLDFLDKLKASEICSHFDGITEDGWIYYETAWGEYKRIQKATPKQIAIYNAIGDLYAALCMKEE